MRKIFFLCSLILLIIGSPPAARANNISGNEATERIQNEKPDVHLENYGNRYIIENGNIQSIGLYKIIVGDPRKLKLAMSLNKSNGFDGLVYTTLKDKKEDWQKIRVHRPVKERKGWKESGIVEKDKLPYPFNQMTDELLNKILFVNVYPDIDDVAVVYIVEGTKFSECKKIFNFISEKKKNPGDTAGL
jgi:hypothetical protein